MAKVLTITQRNFIMEQVIKAAKAELDAFLNDEMPTNFRQWVDISSACYLTTRSTNLNLYITNKGYANPFDDTTCSTKEDWIKSKTNVGSIKLPRDWYNKQMKAGYYELTYEFEPCMSQPRPLIKFKNEIKAKRAASRKLAKDLAKSWSDAKEVYSDLQYRVMEGNKALLIGLERVILAGNEDAGNLMNEVTEDVRKEII